MVPRALHRAIFTLDLLCIRVCLRKGKEKQILEKERKGRKGRKKGRKKEREEERERERKRKQTVI